MILTVREFVARQEYSLKALNNTRIFCNGYEYRITFRGGISCYMAIDRREMGKRNFKYFGGFAAYKYGSPDEALEKIREMIRNDVS